MSPSDLGGKGRSGAVEAGRERDRRRAKLEVKVVVVVAASAPREWRRRAPLNPPASCCSSGCRRSTSPPASRSCSWTPCPSVSSSTSLNRSRASTTTSALVVHSVTSFCQASR